VWKPKDNDQAKIGLANGQPGSDTKTVGAGFRGHTQSQKLTPRIITSPGFLLLVDTSLLQITKRLQELDTRPYRSNNTTMVLVVDVGMARGSPTLVGLHIHRNG
jgi:hypothetical protein